MRCEWSKEPASENDKTRPVGLVSHSQSGFTLIIWALGEPLNGFPGPHTLTLPVIFTRIGPTRRRDDITVAWTEQVFIYGRPQAAPIPNVGDACPSRVRSCAARCAALDRPVEFRPIFK